MIAAFLPCACALKCNAAEQSESESVSSRIDGIIEDFYGAVPDGVEMTDGIDGLSESVGIKRILEGIINAVKDNGGELGRFLLTLIAIALMSALASQASGAMAAFASRSVGVVSSALLLERLIFLVSGAVASLKEINGFFGAVIPVALAVNSLGVSPTTASAQAVGMGLTLGLYSFIVSELLGAIVGVIFVGSAASAIDPLFERLSRNVKNLFLSVMGILTVLVGASFSLQSSISASADSAVLRSARYAVSSTIPIVGNAVSGALGVVTGGVSYARGIVGGGAVAVVISLMLAPLVTLLCYRLCLKAGVFFTSLSSVSGCESVLAPFLSALDALVAVYSLTSVIYIVEMVAFLKGGASVA